MSERFQHQQKEWDDHKFSRARAYLWQMRTGKTRMAIESAVALHWVGEIYGVLVVAPNGVHRQWAEQQIPRWGEGRAFAWRFGNPKNQHDWALWRVFASHRGVLRWLCVNLESMIRDEVKKAIADFKRAVGPAMLIVDESHHFARPGSKRTAMTRGLGREFEYRRILTGTPLENDPEQAFSQFEILERAAMGHVTYNASKKAHCPSCHSGCKGFMEEYCELGLERRGPNYARVVTGHKNLDKMKERMARYASVVLRSDCEDLPPLQFDEKWIEMTERQQKFWDAVKYKQILENEKLGIDRVFQAAAALVKLQQVEGGFFRHQDTKVVEDLCGEANPKMLMLLDEIMLYDGRVIVWFAYTHELEAAYEALRRAKIPAGRFYGKIGQADREKALSDFRKGMIRALLAQPQAGGEGRDMSGAGKMVWYSHTPDGTVRSQANERATAMGGGSVQVVDLLGPVGKYFRDMTDDKRSVADDLSRQGLRKVLENVFA